MLVKYWMNADVVAIDLNDSIETVANLFNLPDINILPVVKNGTLIGILSENDIKTEAGVAVLPSYIQKVDNSVSTKKVADFLKTDSVTVYIDHTIEEALEIFIANSISNAPVIDHRKRLVGMIGKSNLLRAVVAYTGARRGGIIFAFNVADRPGEIQKLTDAIRRHSGRIASVFSTRGLAPKNHCRVYIRVFGIDRFKLRRLTEELKRYATIVYSIDRPENRMESGRHQSLVSQLND
jgi:acetoin utilization protein AcuB